MIRNIITCCTFIFLLLQSATLHAQEQVPVVGIRAGQFFNIGGSTIDDRVIVAATLPVTLRIGPHESFLGMVFPYINTEMDGYSYLSKKTYGFCAGYKYYCLNPSYPANIFLKCELQYMYFYGHFKEGRKTGYEYYQDTDYILRNILGVGFNAFFGKKQNAGFSVGYGYILNFQWHKNTDEQTGETYTGYQGFPDDALNLFEFYFDIYVKLGSLK